MATGMQTGRGTRASALRTGTAPKPAGGGGIGGLKAKWEGMESKHKTIIIIVAAVLLVAAVSINFVASSNKPVPLYSTNLTTSDTQKIQTTLSQLGIPHEVAEGGTSVLVPPKYRRKAILLLAAKGIPSRPVQTTGGEKDGGITPPTRDEKERQALQELSGDLVETIRQIDGVADAYIKIVPQPAEVWGGENKTTATASIMLKLVPGAVLDKNQITGIVNMVAFSVQGLQPENIKVVDTTGHILNDKLGDGGMNVAGGDGKFTTAQLEEKKAIEDRLQRKVSSSLMKMMGSPDRFDVQVSVDMDFSQKEVSKEVFGGPANVDGVVESARQEDIETYTSDPGKESEGGAETMSAGGEKSNYIKKKIVVRKNVNKITARTVDVSPRVKNISCAVTVDGIKDPKVIAKIQSVAEHAIGAEPARGDKVAVESVPFIRTGAIGVGGGGMSAFPINGNEAFPTNTGAQKSIPNWVWPLLAVPVLLLVLMMALFYIKQKSVQKEKQRLVLTTGPGATVSDISDLLADKEGKLTPPAATKVNTTDQLEKLAKEKPTKVAELLKSTWLADQ